MQPETPAGGDGALSPYQTYFDELPCYLSVQDRDYRVLDANHLFRQRFGGREGGRCFEAYKGRSTPCRECAVRDTFERGEPQQGEETLVDGSGHSFPVFAYTSPILDERGEVVRVMKLAVDISSVKRLQKRLHRAQQQFQQLFHEVPCYITVQNPDLKITHANRRFREDFGDENDCYCFEAYKHRDEPCLDCPVVKTFSDGRSHRSEEVVTSLGGDRYNVLVQTAPLRDGSGEITHVVEMSTNITELRQLQDQLTSLGLMVGSISHNLKGLITSLDGGMYLVNTGLKRKDQGRIEEGWEIVQRNFGRIRAMVLDILSCAKEREIQMQRVDATSFAAEICEMFEVKADALDIELVHSIDPHLGDMLVDAGALRSALVAILENSLDACRLDPARKRHRVSFSVRGDADLVRFSVQDNGIGMDRETRERLFTLFFSSKGSEGTGLGLYIANRIVRKHNGHIEVTSTPEVGSSFLVTIPRQADPSYTDPPKVSTPAPTAR